MNDTPTPQQFGLVFSNGLTTVGSPPSPKPGKDGGRQRLQDIWVLLGQEGGQGPKF